MNEGAIYFLERDHLLILKLVGTIRIASREAGQLSAGLEAFIRSLPQRKGVNQLLIDLSEAVVIDSTHLGLLAQAAQFTLSRWRRRPTLVSTNPEINAVLESVCFDQVFLIVRDAGLPTDELKRLEAVAPAEAAPVRLMLEAHRALAQITPANEQQFRNVIELLDQEAQRSPAPFHDSGPSPR